MLTEKDIIRHCDSRVLRRARNLVKADASIFDRRCQYKPGKKPATQLHANVSSADDWRTSYDVILKVDESEGEVLDYDCTCPSSLSHSGMCKHVTAVALVFLEHPDTFLGYDLNRNAKSSDGISKLLKSVEDRRAAGSGEGKRPETEHLGTIDLGVLLTHDTQRWSAKFRISGATARYVIKDLPAFLDAVDKQETYSYGTKLSFAHRKAMFTDHALDIIAFLQRAVPIRQELENDQLSSYHLRPKDLEHDLFLSTPELVELLDLLDKHVFYVDDLNKLNHKARKAHVIDGNPPIRVEFTSVGDGGFEMHRDEPITLVASGNSRYIWQNGAFYRCTPDYAEVEEFLRDVYSNKNEVQFISEQDAPAFCSNVLPSLEKHLEVIEPPEMEVMRPRPCEVIVCLDRAGKGISCEAYAQYDDERCGLFEAKAERTKLSYGLRDLGAERVVRRLLARYFPVVEGKTTGTQESPMRLSDEEDITRLLFEGLRELRAHATVLTTPEFDGLISRRRPHASIGISFKANLINLTVSADDLPRGELVALLNSYRRRKRYHRLKDGSFVDLANADLAEADDLLVDLDLMPEDLRDGSAALPAYRALQLDDLVADEQKDAAFVQYVNNFEQRGMANYQVPASLHATLRPYQVEGFEWLCTLSDMGFGGILADEMGLGKSVQLISYLVAQNEARAGCAPALIVCPASLVYNWIAEFEKFAPGLCAVAVAGSKPERDDILIAYAGDNPTGTADVLVTSYDLMRRDVEVYQQIGFSCVALDEAQYIKNHATLAAQAVKSIRSQHRFALTGTPIENRLSELWSIFDFLMPGLLGSYRRFRERYEQPIVDGQEEAMHRLRELVGHFVMRRLKSDVLVDLPEKSENVVYAHMEGEQLRLYRAHEQRLRESIVGKSTAEFARERIAVLAELTRLREICCDPHLVFDDYDDSSAKLSTILDLVETAIDSGKKLLLFSQFTSYLDIISERLSEQGVAHYTITGATPKRQRLELVNEFNEDDTPVFLVSLKAGGTGLNLTGASVVIHADPWWNSAAEDQATDRAHRIGQTKDVMVYKVIAKDSIEERILALQETKSDLAGKLINSEGLSLSSLSRDELVSLLS